MKHLIAFLIVIGFVVGGAFFFLESRKAEAPADEQAEEELPRTYEIPPSPPSSVEASVKIYSSSAYGITFYYPSTYYLKEDSETSSRLQKTIVLVEDTPVHRQMFDGTYTGPGREGPVSITVDIHPNPKKLSAEAWLKEDQNWDLGSKKITPIAVGGRDGASFTWDGLYLGRTSVVMVGDRAYVFVVDWTSPVDPILRDYESIIKSVVFEG